MTAQSRPVVTFDGRYMVWLTGSPMSAGGPVSVAFFDRLHGQAGVVADLTVQPGRLFADRRAFRLYIAHNFSVTSSIPLVWILELAMLNVIAEVSTAHYAGTDVQIDDEQPTVLSFASARG